MYVYQRADAILLQAWPACIQMALLPMKSMSYRMKALPVAIAVLYPAWCACCLLNKTVQAMHVYGFYILTAHSTGYLIMCRTQQRAAGA